MAAYLVTTRRTSEVCSRRPLRVNRRAPSGGGEAAPRRRPRAPRPVEVTLERRGGFVAERYDPHLAPLAAYQQLAARRAHVVAAHVDQLLAAQPAAVQQLEHEPVAQGQRVGAAHRVADRVDFGRSQGVWQAPPATGARKVLRGV